MLMMLGLWVGWRLLWQEQLMLMMLGWWVGRRLLWQEQLMLMMLGLRWAGGSCGKSS